MTEKDQDPDVDDRVDHKYDADSDFDMHVPLVDHPFNAKKAHGLQYGVLAAFFSALPVFSIPFINADNTTASVMLLSISFAIFMFLMITGILPTYSNPDENMYLYVLYVIPHYGLSMFAPLYIILVGVFIFLGQFIHNII